MHLARQARVITLFLGSVRTPGVNLAGGRTIGGYHNISHHGKDEKKLKQLAEIEVGQMELLVELLQGLKDVEEPEGDGGDTRELGVRGGEVRRG